MKINKNVDELFKEGLGESRDDIIFNEHEWDMLEQRLDKAEKNKRIVFWLKRASGIAAILLLGFALWQIPLLKQATNKDKSDKYAKGNNAAKDQAKPEHSLSDQSAITRTTKPSELIASKAKQKEILPFSKKTPQSDTMVNQEDENTTMLTMKPSSSEKLFAASKSISLDVDSGKLSGLMKKGHSLETKTKSYKPKFADRVVLTFSAAPALNGVNNLKNADLGGDIGMLLTYGLSKKWSVTSGAIYAKKIYSTAFENYNPNSNYRFKYNPSSVYADCRVLDIPLNVNYTVFNKKSNKISLSTGLSSYLMLREDYNFNYDLPNSTYPQKYEVKNKNQHWLGVVNLQASYERRINPNMGIGIQPFVKIPINGIGYSQVKLKTIGVAINLNFNLGAGSKK